MILIKNPCITICGIWKRHILYNVCGRFLETQGRKFQKCPCFIFMIWDYAHSQKNGEACERQKMGFCLRTLFSFYCKNMRNHFLPSISGTPKAELKLILLLIHPRIRLP